MPDDNDPIALGEELACYLIAKRKANKVFLDELDGAALSVIELAWERDFWRDQVFKQSKP